MSSFLNTKNGLYGFGKNSCGELGLGRRKLYRLVLVPIKLEFSNNHKIISVEDGGYHVIINTDRYLYVFGSNNFGQLGLGDLGRRYKPVRLRFFDKYEILSIHCGMDHTIVYTTDGLFVFGSDFWGQLGLNHHFNKYEPTKLDFFDKYDILSIRCSWSDVFVNTTVGLYVFGHNNHGQLGLGSNEIQRTPTKLDFFDNHEINSICGGVSHTIVHTKNGIYVFGSNSKGQLGLGDTDDRNVPTKLKFFDDHEILSINCGHSQSIIKTTKGLYVFGNNTCGELGLGDTDNRNVPTKLNFFDDFEIETICCYWSHNIINTTNGLYVFGYNKDGQLGLGDTENRCIPTKLEFEHEIIPFGVKPNKIKSAASLI